MLSTGLTWGVQPAAERDTRPNNGMMVTYTAFARSSAVFSFAATAAQTSCRVIRPCLGEVASAREPAGILASE